MAVTDLTPIKQFQDLSDHSNNTHTANHLPNQKMVKLIRTITLKMGGSGVSPMMGMLTGMMPLVETKIMEVSDENMTALATIMSESFGRVANPEYSMEEFDSWLVEFTKE